MYIVVYKDCVLYKAELKIDAMKFITNYAEKLNLEFWQQISQFHRSTYNYYKNDIYYSFTILKE